MKEWYTAAELAELGLFSLPSTKRNINAKANRENWQSRPRVGRGGGKEYPLSALPVSARDELAKRAVVNAIDITDIWEKAPAKVIRTVEESNLKGWQLEVMNARAALLAEIDRLSIEFGRSRAIKVLIETAKENRLSPALMEHVHNANVRKGGNRTLSRRSVFNWLKARDEQGIVGLAPLPARKENASFPEWADTLFKLYNRPQKPSLADCIERIEEFLPKGVKTPSYGQANRLLKSMSFVTRNRGRIGYREMKNYKAYVTRDTSELWPGAIYSSDGHTFDAEIAHPFHGRPFRPEVTTVIDIYTRKAVGWSVGLSESACSVSDALRHSVETNGVPDIWYVDNGKGFNNKTLDMVLARLGVTKTNSIPYNSQARGAIERLHLSIFVRNAKLLPTYMGADMDPEAGKRVYKITRKEIKEQGYSRLLPAWNDFVVFCERCVDEYNNRPHSYLPKIRDFNGKKRHMTPNEMWEQGNLSKPDYRPEIVTGAISNELFRPYVIRKCRRAMVQIYDNFYGHENLLDHTETEVAVGYDIHDASKVWVRKLDNGIPGALICVASFDHNKRSYYPVSFAERAREKRAKGRLNRVDVQRNEIIAEAGGEVIKIAPPEAPISEAEAKKLKEIEEELNRNEEKVVNLDNRATRLQKAWEIKERLENNQEVTEQELTWFNNYRNGAEGRASFGFVEDFGFENALDALSA